MNENEAQRLLDESDLAMRKHGFSESTQEQLRLYILAFCKLPAQDPARQPFLAMYSQALQNILLTKLIREIDQRSSRTEFWFMVLAIGSIAIGAIGLLLQIYQICLTR